LLNKEPVSDLLQKWLDKHKPDMVYVDRVVKRANQIIKKFDETITIPYSHFMTLDLTPEWFELIWKYSIVPEVEDVINEEDELVDFISLPQKVKEELREE
jgi:hypothetical protein